MRRVVLKSPVLENCTPGSVRGAPGNRRPYLAKMGGVFIFLPSIFLSVRALLQPLTSHNGEPLGFAGAQSAGAAPLCWRTPKSVAAAQAALGSSVSICGGLLHGYA